MRALALFAMADMVALLLGVTCEFDTTVGDCVEGSWRFRHLRASECLRLSEALASPTPASVGSDTEPLIIGDVEIAA